MGNVSCINKFIMKRSTSMDPAPRSSTPSPYFSPRIESMRENGSDFTERTSSEIVEQSKVHWSEVDRAADSDDEYDPESDCVYFDEVLKKHPEWKHFFKDFPNLEVRHKMAEGGQGAIYYAQRRGYAYPVVVKVLKEGYPLRSLLQQIPPSVLSAKDKFGSPLEKILGATMLKDEKLKNRFALVFEMLICDLRKFIDDRKLLANPDDPPFTIGVITKFMHKIAEDMECLHDKYGIIHKDLKASNVFFSINPMYLVAERSTNSLSVADFECSMSVVGTGFWRAPEILLQLKDRRSGAQVEFTRASDVYSFGMVGYELVTGRLPFEGYASNDYDVVLSGKRPELPENLHHSIRDMIAKCWHPEPSKRPTFRELRRELGLLLNDPCIWEPGQLMRKDHPRYNVEFHYYQCWTYYMGKEGPFTGEVPKIDDSVYISTYATVTNAIRQRDPDFFGSGSHNLFLDT